MTRPAGGRPVPGPPPVRLPAGARRGFRLRRRRCRDHLRLADTRCRPRQNGHQGRQVVDECVLLPSSAAMACEQHAAIVHVEDERIGAEIGHHQPVGGPVLDRLAADAMPSIAGLMAPQASQRWHPHLEPRDGDAGMANPGVDLAPQWPDLRVEARQHRWQRERAVPVTFILGLQQAEAGEGSVQLIHGAGVPIAGPAA